MRRNGIRAEGAKKGQGSVRAGISYLQDMELICHESCHNVATELENYLLDLVWNNFPSIIVNENNIGANVKPIEEEFEE